MYREYMGNRIWDFLNLPVVERCVEFTNFIDFANLHELQDVFIPFINSVFGIGTDGLGWGLRVTTKENSSQSFETLIKFFIPLGPMFRLCYRLVNECIKFEFNLELLPRKVIEMLRSGQYSGFYADLVNVDPFRRQVTSLSLNAFDYYILHFVTYASFPLHKMYPAALQVHSERMKTVYFYAAAEYLSTFLPINPDDVVFPTNICLTVKPPQPMPPQQLQPKRSPKYLKIPNPSLYAINNNNNHSGINLTDDIGHLSARAQNWRSESVLHFFTDIWLRYDIEEARDLPSSEFIRVIRIFIKQIHSFASSASLDQSAMITLRKIAQPMIKARMYPFLKSTISRWPLDSSLSVVLELWLSYIQPWRYTYKLHNISNSNLEVDISNFYDSFIMDNLAIYTQIFVHILPRFQRLDFTSLKNVVMLHRLVKIFTQDTLPNKIFQAEQSYLGSSQVLDSPRKHSNYMRYDNSIGVCEWETIFQQGESYTPLFGAGIQAKIENFLKTIQISSVCVQRDIKSLVSELNDKEKSYGFFKKIIKALIKGASPAHAKLLEIECIPGALENAIRLLSVMFNVHVPNLPMEQFESNEQRYTEASFTQYDNSDYLDMSRVTPIQMNYNISNIKVTVDPALLPIQTNECKVMVRCLHEISTLINEKWGNQINAYWNDPGIGGKLARQFLYPPMTTQWFDKPRGINEMFEENLPPRVCLRPLASYKLLALFPLSLITGTVLWDSPLSGLFCFILLMVIYLFVLAAVRN